MKISRNLILAVSAGLVSILSGCGGTTEVASDGSGDGVEVLFNGKDLAGWIGDAANWSVVDGVIVGTTTDESPLPYNQFLIWDGEVEDFELTADLKLTSDGNNSGIQYRAKRRPDLGDHVVSGYQCDMHPAIWANGMIYDEKGRGIVCKRGMKVVVSEEGKPKIVGELPMEPEFNTGEWSTYKITAQGNHIVHEVNGVQTVDFYDHDEAGRALSGVIAFQIHKGPAMKVEIRNVTLKRLPKSELTAPEATPIPADAADVNPPKPKAAPKGKGKAKDKGPANGPVKGKAPAKAQPKAKAK
tara:strand:+ start:1725 stop:2621 length:897 start_codon:yes stop_codon:yes gene_type:complete